MVVLSFCFQCQTVSFSFFLAADLVRDLVDYSTSALFMSHIGLQFFFFPSPLSSHPVLSLLLPTRDGGTSVSVSSPLQRTPCMSSSYISLKFRPMVFLFLYHPWSIPFSQSLCGFLVREFCIRGAFITALPVSALFYPQRPLSLCSDHPAISDLFLSRYVRNVVAQIFRIRPPLFPPIRHPSIYPPSSLIPLDSPLKHPHRGRSSSADPEVPPALP